MSPHDPTRPEGPALTDLSGDTPMTHETALFVLSLERDGRSVPAEVLAAARAFAAEHPATAAADAELALLSEVLADEPLLATGPGFTDDVVTAARRTGSGRGQTIVRLALARRLAAAATLLVAVTLGWQAARPGVLMADDAAEQQTYLGDAFRADPYAAPDLDTGLEQLVPGPLDGAQAADTGAGSTDVDPAAAAGPAGADGPQQAAGDPAAATDAEPTDTAGAATDGDPTDAGGSDAAPASATTGDSGSDGR